MCYNVSIPHKEKLYMGAFRNIDEAREHFKKDKFATLNGMALDELTDEYSLCHVDLDERHQNAYGGVMGGAIFTLADYAFAALCNNDHQLTVALNVNISFLSAPKGKTLYARCERVKSGRTTGVYNVLVTDDTGRQVALFVGTGYKL